MFEVHKADDEKVYSIEIYDEQMAGLTVLLAEEIERQHGPYYLGGGASPGMCCTFMSCYEQFVGLPGWYTHTMATNDYPEVVTKWAQIITAFPWPDHQ